MNIRVLLGFAVSILVVPVQAMAQSAPDDISSHAIDVELRAVTDQRTRGISDSLLRPGAKLSIQAAHESGLIGLMEAATVSKKQFQGSNGLALTVAGGYRFGDPDAWHFGVGMAAEVLPGARFDAPHGFDVETFSPTTVRSTRYDTAFAVFEWGYGALEGRVMRVMSKNYRGISTGGVCGTLLSLSADPTRALDCYARGDHGARGSWLFDLDYKIPLDGLTTLVLHVGHQRIAHFSEANYTDYRIGLTHRRWGFEWGIDWIDTHVKERTLFQTLDGDRLRDTHRGRLVLSVARRF